MCATLCGVDCNASHHQADMKKLALTALLAVAALAGACGRTPTDPASHRAPVGALDDGYLGSGNRHDSTTVRKVP